jgi:hypothetical protein
MICSLDGVDTIRLLAGWLANRYLPFLARERETAPADLFSSSSSFYSGRLHTAADRVPKQTNHHLLSCPSRPSPPPLPPLTHGAIYTINQQTKLDLTAVVINLLMTSFITQSAPHFSFKFRGLFFFF